MWCLSLSIFEKDFYKVMLQLSIKLGRMFDVLLVYIIIDIQRFLNVSSMDN